MAFGQFSIQKESRDNTMIVTLSFPGMCGGGLAEAPFSGERSTEYIETRSDGTKTSRRQLGEKLWRDFDGPHANSAADWR
jgi:hypothetical protein